VTSPPRVVSRSAIGVFDSGIGGLTVLAALRRRLPNESIVYLGDTARVPYGTRSPAVITRYAINNGRFLAQFDLKLLVVACNTVSAVALPALADALPIPVLGVVEPGAAEAVRLQRGHVGVIGTPGTILSGAYQTALQRMSPGVRLSAVACNLFVPLAEEGWLTGEVPLGVARRYLEPLRSAGVDTLVLGCTHYPLLKPIIAEVMGASVTLVDSAESSARAAEQLLRERDLLVSGGVGEERYFVTDLSAQFGAVAERFLGRAIVEPEVVDLSI
jgi:glutamate racemase